MPNGACRLGEVPLGSGDDFMYELCTSAGFSGNGPVQRVDIVVAR